MVLQAAPPRSGQPGKFRHVAIAQCLALCASQPESLAYRQGRQHLRGGRRKIQGQEPILLHGPQRQPGGLWEAMAEAVTEAMAKLMSETATEKAPRDRDIA